MFNPHYRKLPETTSNYLNDFNNLPARLDHTWEMSLECFLSETDAAETKATHETARTATHGAAVLHAHSILAPGLSDNH
jgi:hypothetical protein